MNQESTEKPLRYVFKNPDSSSRGTPFWAWNGKAEPEKMMRQIACFKEMGMGGFIVHSRTGLQTPYLGKEFMETMHACVKEAGRQGLSLHLYDEDRWPSGFGGGFVTRNKEYRAKFLVFSRWPSGGMPQGMVYHNKGRLDVRPNSGGKCLCGFLVKLENGYLKSYQCIPPDQIGDLSDLWYLHEEVMEPSPWFNNQTYMDTLNPEAVKEFIDVTYERYREELEEEFGKTVPSVFTDEPQFIHKHFFQDTDAVQWMTLPYTDRFEEKFQERWHTSFLERIPEMLWNAKGQKDFTIRYGYHRLLLELFAESYCDQIGNWCERNGIHLTGHMKGEGALALQAGSLGEAMRNYRYFHEPGIDILCDKREYITAKQVQSAARQMGKREVTCEMYGVTGWEFTFAGHKLQGDWLAALGVTRRVPHLAWSSMEGEAKRDFPASIFYQAPWYREYAALETYFARIISVLKAGTPAVHVGVIHPIESFWISYGQVGAEQEQEEQEKNFARLLEWLLLGNIDFDLISESLLEVLDTEILDKKLKAGQMEYQVILAAGLKGLRSGTLQLLEEFRQAGGMLIFTGEVPTLIDGISGMRAEKLVKKAERIEFSEKSILDCLENVRDLEITDEEGSPLKRYLYQMRQTEEGIFLFLADGLPLEAERKEAEMVHLYVKGAYQAECWNPFDGSSERLECQIQIRRGKTVTHLARRMYRHDSLLLYLCSPQKKKEEEDPRPSVHLSAVRLQEPNVMLLDQAQFRLDNGKWEETEEILRIENRIRKQLHLPLKGEDFAQPWTGALSGKEKHLLTLQYMVHAEEAIENLSLALEDAENKNIWWNGRKVKCRKKVPDKAAEWYVDPAIGKIPLGMAQKGENFLVIQMAFSGDSNLEACYLLGDFWVKFQRKNAETELRKCRPVLYKSSPLCRYGDITGMGYPFYSGNLEYVLEINVEEGEYFLEAPFFTSPLLSVKLDGKPVGQIAFSPYRLGLGRLSGRHEILVTAFGNRQNTFGPLHNARSGERWIGPSAWRTEGADFTYGYRLSKNGILKAPVLRSV